MRRLAAVLALSLLAGCATVLGTAISPVTVPIDAVWIASGRGFAWRDAYGIPIAIVCAPLLGLLCGLDADYHIIDPGWEWPVLQIFRPIHNMPGH